MSLPTFYLLIILSFSGMYHELTALSNKPQIKYVNVLYDAQTHTLETNIKIFKHINTILSLIKIENTAGKVLPALLIRDCITHTLYCTT